MTDETKPIRPQVLTPIMRFGRIRSEIRDIFKYAAPDTWQRKVEAVLLVSLCGMEADFERLRCECGQHSRPSSMKPRNKKHVCGVFDEALAPAETEQ